MSNLTRWDPFQEMMTFRNMMDRFFDTPRSLLGGSLYSQEWELALDIVEDDDEYLVKASLPGIHPDDLDVTYEGNLLTIKGEIRKDEEVEDQRYRMRERRYGSFSRSISLPSGVKADQIDAQYQAGVLTLRLPKSEQAKPKRIKVQTSEAKQLIEGKLSSSKKK